MAATLKYQGREESKNKTSQSYKQTWQGTQAEVDSVISGLPVIGAFVTGKGFMTSYRKSCDDGPYWSVEVEYTIEKDSSSFDNSDDTIVGKKSAQLPDDLDEILRRSVAGIKGIRRDPRYYY